MAAIFFIAANVAYRRGYNHVRKCTLRLQNDLMNVLRSTKKKCSFGQNCKPNLNMDGIPPKTTFFRNKINHLGTPYFERNKIVTFAKSIHEWTIFTGIYHLFISLFVWIVAVNQRLLLFTQIIKLTTNSQVKMDNGMITKRNETKWNEDKINRTDRATMVLWPHVFEWLFTGLYTQLNSTQHT